ncbi:hypothetical protein [Desulfoluna sp.]|uniref:hypothetical protein n=1 Tax=Desulfoluna sp. TaxID=2045199 RepID=UPI0026062DDC|nr:hypothetical protein [Desulfoluna sp.]
MLFFRRNHAVSSVIVASILLVLVQLPQHDYRGKWVQRPFIFNIDTRLISLISIGHEEVIADYLWLQLVSRFGSAIKNKQDAEFVYEYLEYITDISPMFEGVYEFAGMILPSVFNDVDGSVFFVEKGLASVSTRDNRYWKLLFYQGFNYFFYKNDYSKAAFYMEQAATYSQSPKYLPLLVARLYSMADKEGDGIGFLDSVIALTDDPYLLVELNKRRDELVADLGLEAMQSAVDLFRSSFLVIPCELSFLVFMGFIQDPYLFDLLDYYEIRGDGVVVLRVK